MEKLLKICFVASLLLGVAGMVQANATVSGTIYNANGGSTVDYWDFSVNTAGTIVFDVLAYEHDMTTFTSVDINGDGEFTYLDSEIYLFNDDGSLDAADYIAYNGDYHTNGFADGTVYGLDSYLSVDLSPGDYVLAMGSFYLSRADAIDGFNDGTPVYGDHGDYQISFIGDVTVQGVNAVPAPDAILLGSIGCGIVGWLKRRRSL